MLTLIPDSWFSWNFRVLRNDADLTVIRRDWFRERGTFEIRGVLYAIRRTSWIRSTFALERDGHAIAEASKPSSFRRLFDITADGNRLELRPASWFGREFQLYRGTELLGVVRPNSFWSRTATADLLDSIALPIQLFTIFLVLVLWKRASDRAAS